MEFSRRSMLLSTAALLTPTCPWFGSALAAAIPGCESRAILDEGLHWSTPDGARRVISRIKKAGFNVFIPCVWHGRGASWPSRLVEWDDRLVAHVKRDARYDPLAYLLRIAADEDIQVHPWFTVTRRARNLFPEYALQPDSTTFNLYDVRFRAFFASLVAELVQRYEVQGINLDYVRFGSPLATEAVERERAVSDVIRRTRDIGKTLRPDLILSVDAAPWEPTMKDFGQDAVKWADEGLVDVAYSMQYQPEPDLDAIARFQASMQHPERLVMIVGNFDRVGAEKKVIPRDPEHLSRLIRRTRELSSGNGIAVYYYGMLSDAQIDSLGTGVLGQLATACWTVDDRQV